MKIKLDEQNKKLALALFIAGSGIALVCFTLYHIEVIYGVLSKFIRILFPFITGFLLAFFLLPLYKWFEKFFMKKTKFKAKTIKALSISLVLFFLLGIIVLVVVLIVPSVINSIISLSDNIKFYINHPYDSLPFVNDWHITKLISEWWKNQGTSIMSRILDIAKDAAPSLLSISVTFAQRIIGFLIGIIVMVYGLYSKDKLSEQLKRLSYALFPNHLVDEAIDVLKYTQMVFDGFVIGKLLDSFIIGIICYVAMLIFGMEYPLIISLIVGITNVIPFFGPFIGAIPGFAILVIINPVKACLFLIWILVLQQFDGNILGPKILGDKVGLPSIWVMFAIIVGGGLWGFVGMFVSVPLFAVIYSLVNKWVSVRLEKKKINI